MNYLIESLGWIGSLVMLIAYILNLRGRWTNHHPLYLWFNVVGGVFLVINTYFHQAYAATGLEVVWVIVALPSLLKHWRIR
ncbi:MAG: hypothetical protein LH606_15335 [Cytophagaceae bacterium]|nr:hypothetical protein [Cytophagaceae bacterium]